jgi:membrane-associated phospholipid phosphatase
MMQNIVRILIQYRTSTISREAALLVLDAAMLCSTITEGAHYATDVVAGSCLAFAAYFLANRVIGAKNHLSGELLAMYPVACDTAGATRAV